MMIHSLPWKLQQIVHQRQKEQGNDGIFTGDIGNGKDDGNFNWDETPEEDFWDQLYYSSYEDAKDHPLNHIKTITYDIY